MSDVINAKKIVDEKRIRKIIVNLDKKIAELEREILLLRTQKQGAELLLNPASATLASSTDTQPRSDTTEQPKKRKRTRKGVHTEVHRILKNSQPMTPPEIVEKLKSEGFEFKSARPETTIYVAVSRHPELFRKDSMGRWEIISDVEK